MKEERFMHWVVIINHQMTLKREGSLMLMVRFISKIVIDIHKIWISRTAASNVTGANDKKELIVGPMRVLPGRLSVSRTFGDVEAKLT